MLKDRTPEQIRAMADLEGHAPFSVLLDYLREAREELRESMEASSDVGTMQRLQGASRAIGDLLEMAANARERMHRRIQ